MKKSIEEEEMKLEQKIKKMEAMFWAKMATLVRAHVVKLKDRGVHSDGATLEMFFNKEDPTSAAFCRLKEKSCAFDERAKACLASMTLP